MSRQLPEYKIKGTVFLVDVVKMELREKADALNIISFGAMYDYRRFHLLEYDELKKNAKPKDYGLPDKERQKDFITIPQMCELDPQGVAEMYGLSVEQVKGKCDYELWIAKHGEKQRIEREWLPVLDIGGVAHDVHLMVGRIYPQGEKWDLGISIASVPADKVQHTFYYNVKTFKQYWPSPDMTVLPKDVFQITIPGPARLDPVWFAYKHRKPPRNYLKRYPLVMYRKVELIPLEKTKLAELVRLNLRKKAKKVSGKRAGR